MSESESEAEFTSPDAPAPEGAAAEGPSPEAPSREVLQRALKAFKKRLKLTQLDRESSLGVGPMSGGRPSGIVAIRPPIEYPREVWEALVAEGRLKKASPGQYELC